MRLRLVRALLCLPCLVLLAPAVAADSPDEIVGGVLPEYVTMPGAPDPWGPLDGIESAPLDGLFRLLGEMIAVPGPKVGLAYEVAFVSIECERNAAGQTECRGYVCPNDNAEGSDPVSTGPRDKPGVGIDPEENPDGSYGPYVGVFVSKDGKCGCITWVI